MIRYRKWSLLAWVCAVCLMGACTRPAPKRLSQDHTVVGGVAPSERQSETGIPSPQAAEALAASTEPPSLWQPTAAAELTSAPTATVRDTDTGTPAPDPTPVGNSSRQGVESHVVRRGETLGYIASTFDCTVQEIVAANNLANPNSIFVGQTLLIPVSPTRTGPALKLIPDSETVYGPSYIHFDVAAWVAGNGGYLAAYSERVEGELLTGSEIVQLVAQRFSLGPRVLLTLLELMSGWVTNPQPRADTLFYPLGHFEERYEGLYDQLSWAGVRLNEGYYGWRRGDRNSARLVDWTSVAISPEVNAGTAGVQNCLAELSATWEEWLALSGQQGFLSTYQRLFGNPFANAVDPLVPDGLAQPELRLPWEAGGTWYLTGGPHGAWADGSGRAALDFVTGDGYIGCQPSRDWVTAAAPGLVVRSDNGEVLLDLDGDGFEQTGWVLYYLHIYHEGRVEVGTYVKRGQRIGRPSCEGGYSEATHLHFARRYNGEWMPAGSGPAAMTLSGWTAREGTAPYEGSMVRGQEVRTACECWEDEVNDLLSDNAP